MRWIFYALFLAIASRLFAGIYFYIAAKGRAPLRRLRLMFGAVAVDGLLLAAGVVWRITGIRNRWGGVVFFTLWLCSQIAVTATEWGFVIDTFKVGKETE